MKFKEVDNGFIRFLYDKWYNFYINSLNYNQTGFKLCWYKIFKNSINKNGIKYIKQNSIKKQNK